jgi:hypothetical protein
MRLIAASVTALCIFIGLASAEEFFATVKKVDGTKITINKSKKDAKVDDVTLTAIDKVKVLKGKGSFDKETKKFTFTDGTAVEEGLKSDLFAKDVRAQIVTNDKDMITEIRIVQKKKKNQ